ncbi:MAG TPA: hypothetical protein VGT78_07370 [Rhizomicrobium sp.]|nr:hypothetical protein [Rhizomicrobium sp.]
MKRTPKSKRKSALAPGAYREWMLAAAKRSHRTEDAPAVVVGAVRHAEMSKRHSRAGKRAKSVTNSSAT